jgi:uncharacterized protein YbjT (DUF2867 family)
MPNILLAGVTGSLGAQVARLLIQRGHHVRGLARDAARVPKDLALTSTHIGDARIPDTLTGVMAGIDTVFSCLGASVSASTSAGRRGFTQVDTPANLALLEEAQRAGVKRFVYVSVFHNDAMESLAYIRAHEEVVHAIKRSGLEFSIIRPTGFFSALAELLPMAKNGRLPSLKGGLAKSNPIHEGDLAQVCVEAIEKGPEEVPAGGPDVLTRNEMNQLAFTAVGKPNKKSTPAPLFAMKAAAFVATPFQPRIAQLIQFIAALSEHDLVAPVRGTRHLSDYFAERVARTSSLT